MNPVVLPNLRAASFHFTSPAVVDMVQHLEMPMLETFSIEYAFRQFQIGLPSSSPRLKILRAQLHYPPMNAGDLERALEMLPDLTEISIDVPHIISNGDVFRLIPVHDQLPLAPKLKIVRLLNRCFRHNSCEWRTLAAMLQARFQATMPGVSRLHTFEFSVDDRANDHNLTTALRTLRAQHHWDIRVDRECRFPAWDELYLTSV
ncbi:hypothetical protein MVEN_01675600 [Mycena venus]|uniref:Uncharacterized protein n=1 Tax=Mycena venus TaxID=2733690 RepID=A0A8H7CP98_9AGAR|nr:hypothetical protein MVEN_01675600 [Mycena venus]